MKKQNEELTLKDLIDLFIPKLWLIAAVSVIVAVILGLGSEFLVKDTYTSKVTLYSYMETNNTNINDITVAQQQVKTYEQLFKSKKFLNSVVAELSEEDRDRYVKLGSTPTIKIQQKDSTEVFDVSVTSTDPEMAFKMAEAIAAVSVAKIPELIPNAGDVTIIDDPVLPTVSNSKNVMRNAVIGFVGGMILTIIAIFVYNIFDVTIRDRKKIEDHIDSPILSIIPRHEVATAEASAKSIFKAAPAHDSDKTDKLRVIDDKTPFAISEAFRTLYTGILYLPVVDKCKKIAVTSAFSGEGKTYISMNLALTIARSDSEHKVLLIDADMRKPRLANLLEGINTKAHGLSEYLAAIDDKPNIQQSKVPNLSVLTSGSESANATGLISSSRLGDMIKELEGQYNYIIFDTPPANIVSDAILLNDHLNGYLVVARADYSDINSLSDTVESIQQIGGTVYGVCLTSIVLKGYNKKYGKYRKYSRYGRYARYSRYEGYEKLK